MEADQFPNFQQDMALIVAFSEVKKKKNEINKKIYQNPSTVCLEVFGYIVNLVFASQACIIPGHKSETKCAAEFKLQRSADGFSTFTAAKLGRCAHVARV